jgi:signal transduction histidine kinase
MKILQTSQPYLGASQRICEKIDRLFSLSPWEVKKQTEEFEAGFRTRYQAAAYSQVLVALGISFILASLLLANYLSMHGWSSSTFVFRALISLSLGASFCLFFFFKEFVRRNYDAYVAFVTVLVLILLCGLAITLPHEGIQLLATIPNILLVYLFLFGFARISLLFALPIALCVVPLAVYVLQSHDQPIETQLATVLNLLIFILAGVFLNRSIERRERSFHIATFRSEESKHKRTQTLGYVLHDLRSPLLAVELSLLGLVSSANMRNDGALSKQVIEILRVVGEARELTANALDETTSFDAGHAAEVSEVSLTSTLQTIAREVGLISTPTGARFYLVSEADAQVLTSAPHLKSILRNLIGNALKFSDVDKPMSWILIRARNLGDRTYVYVHDNGFGIPKGLLGKIWSPGFTTTCREESIVGKGLGLSLVKAACESLKGHRISVKSKFGQGTTFLLTLPRVKERSLSRAVGLNDSLNRDTQQTSLSITCVGSSPSFHFQEKARRPANFSISFTIIAIEDLLDHVADSEVPLDLVLFDSWPSVSVLTSLKERAVSCQGYAPVFATGLRTKRFAVLDIEANESPLIFRVGFDALLGISRTNQETNQKLINFE